MKRNRLVSSSSHGPRFKSRNLTQGKRKHVVALSLLSLVGATVTSMVLATSEPVSSTQSVIVDLPNLPAEMQQLPASSALPTKNQHTAKQTQLPDAVAAEHAALEQANSAAVANTQAAPVPQLQWKIITVKRGDNLSLIFPKVGLSARDVYNVAQAGSDIQPLLNLKPGQTLRFGLDNNSLKQLELKLSPTDTLKLSATDSGYKTQIEQRVTDKRQVSASGEINNSLFLDAQKAGLSDKLIMSLAHIFGWDIDFALDLRQGDSFKVLYQEEYLDGKKISDGAILAAEFTNQGKTFQAIRFTDSKGDSHYYAPNGDSMRKAFSRTPVDFTRISSKFNPNRKHPVLKYARPHNGVDYAAPTGTPIVATGDGKVQFIGNKGGYGKVIILTHAGKYSTLYGHMSRFKKGLKRGQRVKQGQVIGYVGMSGLATGPHLHYEFRVNGVHRNPLTVALPKADALAKQYMTAFKQQSQPLLAQLEQIQTPTQLALSQN